jgi:hypothetical protein
MVFEASPGAVSHGAARQAGCGRVVFGVDRLGRRVLEGRVKVCSGMAGKAGRLGSGMVWTGSAWQVRQVLVRLVSCGGAGLGRRGGARTARFGKFRHGRHGGDGYGKVWLVEAGEAGNG